MPKSIRLFGAENRAPQPSFYMPNRLDASALEVLVQTLGGAGNISFLVEESFLPDEEMMRRMQEGEVLRFRFRGADSRKLRERLVAEMERGRDVLFVPGRPAAQPGSIADVPMPFMMQLGALHIAPVPLFMAAFRNDVHYTFCTDGDYDWAELHILPRLAPGPQTGERLMEAWMACGADAYARHPLLNTSLARLLVEGMRRYAHIGLVDGMDETKLPYGKMLGVVMALARWLRKNISEPRLGILLPPGKGGVITNYACLLAGIVPVNINYTSSSEAFAAIVRRSGIRRFVTARAFMHKLPQFPWPPADTLIHLDRTLKSIGMAKIAYWVALAKTAPMSLLTRLFRLDERRGDDEATLLFTSGSSGEPKGVSMTHRMIIANITQLRSIVRLNCGDHFLCSLPLFHSFGLTDCTLLPPILGFGMVSHPSPLDAKRLNELTEKYKCRFLVTTPTFARGMLRRASATSFRSVEYFAVGAEKLQASLEEEFLEKHGVQLLEGYGLTEASPACSCNMPDVAPSGENPWYVPGHRRGSVGRVLPGVAVRITDPDDDSRSLPLSEQGMVWFRGANIFSGYLGRPELNEEIFRDGWFKSGDLGSVDLNGFLTLGGRRSRFSKIAGEMVPHEVVEQAIEAGLEPDPTFTGRPIAIAGVPDAQKGEAIVLLSAVHQTRLSEALEDIRARLVAQGLPRLWCPREIIPVESIPVLPTGKLDLRGCHILACEALNLPH